MGFWSGTPPAGTAGRLLLNINDNNPRNGQPTPKWRVLVDVKRAAAAAAGVYIS
jgi:hypothetical protein